MNACVRLTAIPTHGVAAHAFGPHIIERASRAVTALKCLQKRDQILPGVGLSELQGFCA
jgi:hypothetical protein